jgi:hypothetical protein
MSFSSLAGRNATFLLALILMASPVAGLRPIRAGRLRISRTPIPVRRVFVDLFEVSRGRGHNVAEQVVAFVLLDLRQ